MEPVVLTSQQDRKYNVTDATSRAVHFNLPDSLKNGVESETSRIEFNTNQPKNRSFVVKDILTESECDYLIDTTEGIGYAVSDDVQLEYPTSYRNNQRMIFINSDFARTLWIRLQKHLKTEDIFNVTPVGFNSSGVWIPVGLNDGIIFSKYSPGQYFKPHQDGLYINKNEEYSIFSVVVYLNEVPSHKGGQLNFIDPNDKEKITASFTPTKVRPAHLLKGSAIIFNSDAFHEGECLNDGYKFMLRTFIMFKCVNQFSETVAQTLPINKNPEWKEIINLFSTIEKFSYTGDVEKFTKMFLKAQAIQLSKSGTIHDWKPQIPMDAVRLILSELDPYEIMNIAMLINRDWFRMCRDNQTWKRIYLEKPDFFCFRFSEIPKAHLYSFDFFGLYKERRQDVVSVLVIGDTATYLRGDVCVERLASCVTEYSGWDGSMLEPYPIEDNDTVNQNWFSKLNKKLATDKRKIQTLMYFANLARHKANTEKDYKLLLVTFPLIWGNDGNDRISHQSNITEKQYKREPEVICTLKEEFARISENISTSLMSIKGSIGEYGSWYTEHEGPPCDIQAFFLEAGIAACSAYDLRNARIILYQPIVSLELIQTVDIQNLKIKKGSDRFYKTTEIEKSSSFILKNIDKLSKNIVFICDSQRNKSEWKKIVDSFKNIFVKEKVNLFFPSHIDLYYGAKRFSKKSAFRELVEFENWLELRSPVILPEEMDYIKQEDVDYFKRVGKTWGEVY